MLEVLPSRSPDVRLASCGPVMVSCFLNWPNKSNLAAIRDAQIELSRQHPRQFSLTIIPAFNGPLPAGATTASMQQTTDERDAALKDSVAVGKQLEELTVAAAMVILSRGLMAVMIRTFMAGLSLVGSSKYEVKVFKTLAEAEAWLRTIPNAPSIPESLAVDVETWLERR